ncbi:golgin subfamily A member 4 [Spodoptera frugiperda]|uniref:Golgin subfamily A member 4 n=1 Tax=Spodoptera frugiperda TaxID=7108 RepID=A0A9R0EEZ8_SPOFR|nr:golgin subfamily A member 4 [Spodoptera frugiperda]
MFKKLKDKLAEEVKSSPQRIQQFAQAAQAAVTSASSSITDITNSDLFSIGDNDGQQPRPAKAQSSSPNGQQNTFQDVALVEPLQPTEPVDYMSSHDILDHQRQRRLSNSSFASDVSFRLPSYETPSMYHLQSDMEVSASEAEERGFSSGNVSLDRVTKEQLYAAYRRTQERYTKYRTQYGDLARHYKLLERENAKARSVLVETQDKALRRISELREQCALEQSAKAHLEKALRVEIEEKCMKIEALNTKVQLLQSNSNISSSNDKNENKPKSEGDGDVQLINLSSDNEGNQISEESSAAEIIALNNKIEKMEQLLNKYKESLKSSKEKNSQITTEIQILSNELENKNKEIEQLKVSSDQLVESKQKIQELNNINEELQNKINVYEFNKTREVSTLELDFQKAQEEITELRGKIEVFSKREEEYAISLAENKLSIHKELESKETEIKSLKDYLEASKKEIQSLNIVVNDYKNNVTSLEAEKAKLSQDIAELNSFKTKISELEAQIEELTKKCQSLEQTKTKADEGYKCLQLQMKQETAEKLAMIDRNTYLENRNTQLSEENAKKSSQIGQLEIELQKREKILKDQALEDSKKDEVFEELSIWKDKYAKLESEIQEERDELIKLQSEIEKLLANHELLQNQNIEFRKVVTELKSENAIMHEKVVKNTKMKAGIIKLGNEILDLRKLIFLVSSEAKSLQAINNEAFISLTKEINYAFNNISHCETNSNNNKLNELRQENNKLQKELKVGVEKYETLNLELNALRDENNNLKSTITEFELQKNLIDEEVKNITERYEVAINELNFVKEEKENLQYKIKEYENNFQNLQIAMEFEKSQYLESNEKLKLLENEKQTLEDKLNILMNEGNVSNKELVALTDVHNNTLSELDAIKNENNKLIVQTEELNKQIASMHKLEEDNKNLTLENTSLKTQVESIADNYKKLETEINDVRKSHADMEVEKDNLNEINNTLTIQTEELNKQIASMHKLQEDNKTLTLENTSLKTQVESIADNYKKLETEINDVRKSHADMEVEKDNLNEINNTLTVQTEELKKQIASINKLQEDNKTLTLENISLKTQVENIADSYKKLEIEINDVRKSHADMEVEKDHLNEIIEKLESSSCKNTQNNECQTDDLVAQTAAEEEIKSVQASDLGKVSSTSIEDTNLEKGVPSDDQYKLLKSDYDALKEENRRFKSDIEGLQTYLTKISKENSVLNDKLRELIATSEHSTDNTDIANDLTDLKKEALFRKEKIDDLLRENMLLVEENLELKDQLQSQNYPKPEINSKQENDNSLREKYNNLLQVNSTLEKRLNDLEQMNKSVNGNMSQIQEKNEKLRLSNEKLERRLDEALVSLRHLHSLQENTELEYLRNILYEYLTGSGTHSVTLAKVLAAIVKFDDMQTKQVLQKEKERQGFLRQLGII